MTLDRYRFETAKGFTFVHFAQAEAAQASIDELDGRAFGGVEVSVCWYTASSRPGELTTAGNQGWHFFLNFLLKRMIKICFGAACSGILSSV